MTSILNNPTKSSFVKAILQVRRNQNISIAQNSVIFSKLVGKSKIGEEFDLERSSIAKTIKTANPWFNIHDFPNCNFQQFILNIITFFDSNNQSQMHYLKPKIINHNQFPETDYSDHEKANPLDKFSSKTSCNSLTTKILNVENTIDPIQAQQNIDKTKKANVICYHIDGSKKKFKTCNMFLAQRLEQIKKQAQSPKSSQIIECQVQNNQSCLNNYMKQQQQAFRYYKETTICHKCNKSGHTKHSCPEPQLCLFCLSSSHFSEKCTQKGVCFRCGKFGHSISECTIKKYQKCNICEKQHQQPKGNYDVCYFLTNRIKDWKKKQEFNWWVENNEEIYCWNCFEIGHSSCGNSKN